MNILEGLNKEQSQAVQATKGPVLVLAGAGSGKTKALVHRIAYLIKEEKVKPEQILAVTFTNKAAEEMKIRVAELLQLSPGHIPQFGNQLDQTLFPIMGTFHSLSVRILRKEAGLIGYKSEFAIYDTNDQKSTVKQAMDELNISHKDFNPQQILWIISNAKNRLLTPAKFTNEADGFVEEIAAQIYTEYQKILKRSHAMDFDDLIMNTVGIFKKYPDVLKKYQERFRYIMVDEYQDTNHAQYLWISLLAKKYKNIFVVGDDWQAIYGWRGADFKNILNFEKDYKQAKVFYLEQNYRSTQPILDLGNYIIKQNSNQKDKTLWTEDSSSKLPIVIECPDERIEGEHILQLIGKKVKKETAFDDVVYEYDDGRSVDGVSLLDKILAQQKNKKEENNGWSSPRFEINMDGVDLSQHVILYRTNAQSRAMEEVLLTYGVPYRIVGGMKFYDRKEIKDMLALLRFLHNPDDLVSFDRVIDVMGEGIGAKTITLVRRESRKNNVPVIDVMKNADKLTDFSGARVGKLVQFGEMMEDLTLQLEDSTIDVFIDIAGRRTGYFERLKDGTEEGQARLENIAELKTVAGKFRDTKGKEALSLFLEQVALLSDLDKTKEDSSQLTLMTLHSAKGLEFPSVYMIGCEEGLLPHSNSMMSAEEIEEERRLCYVGVTRAKENLYLLHTRERTIFGKTMVNIPSQFITDIPDEMVERIMV